MNEYEDLDKIVKLIFGHDNIRHNEELLINAIMNNSLGVHKQLEFRPSLGTRIINMLWVN